MYCSTTARRVALLATPTITRHRKLFDRIEIAMVQEIQTRQRNQFEFYLCRTIACWCEANVSVDLFGEYNHSHKKGAPLPSLALD
jgi:hypothetical protein